MKLSDLSVQRPVFAAVVSLLLITFGIITWQSVPIREYPDVSRPVVSISTTYEGASAEVVETKITDRIEEQISGIEGVRFIDSRTSHGISRISIEFSVDRDLDSAANDVREAVARISRVLPEEADDPIVAKADSNEDAILYIVLRSDQMSPVELTDYADRVLKKRLDLVSGVSSVQLLGAREYVMRVNLNPEAMAARGISANDLETALRQENIELPAGKLEGQQRTLQLRIGRNYDNANEFGDLMIRNSPYPVYLKDIATIYPGAKNDDELFKADGRNVIALAIIPLSTANPLEVIAAAKQEMETFRPFLPDGASMDTTYDASIFIESAIHEVYVTLGIAIALVVLVIYAFLGSARATLIPAITVPVSLIAAFIVIQVLGYSINLLTLLALVLAIGLVVDDAIVVLENVYRHIEQGKPPLLAAYEGTREVGFAVIATTVVLIATLVPVIFLDGIVGKLFAEYSLTLAGAVAFSSLIALTLSPMLCSKLLRRQSNSSRFSQWVDQHFNSLERRYAALLAYNIKQKWLGGMLLLLTLLVTVTLLPLLPQAFTPKEDRGSIFVLVRGAEGASAASMQESMERIETALLPQVGQGAIDNMILKSPGFPSMGDNSGFLILSLKPWQDRDEDAFTILAQLRKQLATIPNVEIYPIMRSAFSSSAGAPVQFVVGGSDYEQVEGWAQTLMKKAQENPGLADINLDYYETQPQLEVHIDKARAAQLGVSTEAIGNTLEIMLGGKKITTFMERGEEYDVWVKGSEPQFIRPDDLSLLYIRSSSSDQLIRLDNLVSLREVGKAPRLPHYNRSRSVTISAQLVGDYALGDALEYFNQLAQEELPEQAIINYRGESLDYYTNSGSIISIFIMALVIVYLVLAAQFESFVHPLIVMMTVPLGLAGAAIGLWLTGETLNIYSQLALIMLIGLVAKNGILIVEFANQLRDQGRDFDEAIINAAKMRLRPVLMTSLTAVIGALPLLLAAGAGAESRISIGVVIFFGVLLATGLTLIVVPAMYSLLARHTQSPEAVTEKLKQQLKLKTLNN